jgi:hypothetical protein
MKIDETILTRLNELIKRGESVLRTCKSGSGSSGGVSWIGKSIVNPQMSYEWGTSCLNLLSRVFGKDSEHYKLFHQTSDNLEYLGHVVKAQGILRAAKDDYENDYLFDTRALIEAEVFSDFLEQAEHLLNQGYFTASAVIAGSVLEDGLRKLCMKHAVTLSAKPKLDTMNAELAKAGVYNLLKQKQITAMADLRNKAAHGQGGFTKEDVEDMIRHVRRFMEDYFS